MIPRNTDQFMADAVEDLAGIPTPGFWVKWFSGIALPIAAGGYGIACLWTGHGTLAGNRVSMELHGPDAVALGIAFISVAVFFHCHCFWGNIYQLSASAVLGKILSIIAFIATLGYLFVQIFVLGPPR